MEIGSTLGGRYLIQAHLAGEVWAAEDTRSGRRVAVKRLSGPPGPAVRLRHPGIATVLAVGEHDGTPFLAMELLDGYTLDDHLLDGGYDTAQVAHYGAQVADALAVAHRAGASHGRIEPAQLQLTRAGALKILGLGTVPPPHSPDLAALGATLDELLRRPAPPGPPGELGTLISELRNAPAEHDPQLTAAYAARLRRLADEPASAEPPARPRRPPVARTFWIDRRPGRMLLGRVLAGVILAGLIAVTAYAITVTAA